MDLLRQARFRSATDPSTSVEQLLELAMEFPDQVAVNPALAVAIAAEPACLDSADPVALACLLTSPMIPANLSGVLSALARGRQVLAGDTDRLRYRWRMVEEYLTAWQRAGSPSMAVDVREIAPSIPGIPPAFERLTRGQVLLARRLGATSGSAKVEEVEDGESWCRLQGVVGQDGESDCDILKPSWGNSLGSDCEFRWQFDAALPGEHVGRVEWIKSPRGGHLTFCLDRDGFLTASMKTKFPSWADAEDVDIPISGKSVEVIRASLAPLISVAPRIPSGSVFLCVNGEFLLDSARKVADALLGVLERDPSEYMGDEDEEPNEDGDGDEPDPNQPADRLLELVRSMCPFDGIGIDGLADWDDPALSRLIDRQWLDASGSEVASGMWRGAAFRALVKLAEANGWSAGDFDERSADSLIILDGGGMAIVGFYGFPWSAGRDLYDIPMDSLIVEPGPRTLGGS